MGRGRQKAKQTKVARKLKYFSPETDYQALERELSGHSADEAQDQYEDPYADQFDDDDEDEDDDYSSHEIPSATDDEDDWAPQR